MLFMVKEKSYPARRPRGNRQKPCRKNSLQYALSSSKLFLELEVLGLIDDRLNIHAFKEWIV
jgi:hypothetical protein